MPLSVGHITYANCAPFFHYLAKSGFSGEVVHGVPAELNRLLAAGKIDLCPSSSIEYARHPEKYLLLPGHSISSIGPVQSVLLFSDRPLSELDGVPIKITGESATSVALLQVLLRHFMELSEVVCTRSDVPCDPSEGQGLPMLLIGDRALKARQRLAPDCLVFDLGELWYHYTGLPFVFALWIVNRDSAIAKKSEIADFLRQLDASRKEAFRSLPRMAKQVPEKEWMGERELVEYWRKVSYDLDPAHLEGLRCFYVLLERLGLIEAVPELDFID